MINTREVEKTSVLHQGALFAASAAAGFILAGTKISGADSFVGIALTGASSLPYTAAVFVGSLMRCIISGHAAASAVELSAMALCLIARLFFDGELSAKGCGAVTFAAAFISGAAVDLLIGEPLTKLVFYAVYAAAAAFTAACMAAIIDGLSCRRLIDLSSSMSCAYAVIYTMTIASMFSAELSLLNVGAVIGSTVTLLAACNYGYTGGILCGALTACGAFLCAPETGVDMVFIPAAGFLTGYLRRARSSVIAGFFGAASLLFTAVIGLDPNSLPCLTGTFLGALIFLAVSPHFNDKWVITGAEDTALSGIVGTRMSFLAGSIGALRDESGRLFTALAESKKDGDVIGQVSKKVCRNCHRRSSCWSAERELTLRGFEKLVRQNAAKPNDMPFELRDCLHKDEIVTELGKAVNERTAAKLKSIRLTESQRLLSEQIGITEEMIAQASERADVRHSEPLSRMIRLKLAKFGYETKRVTAYYNNFGRVNAELYFDLDKAPESCMRVCDLIADELHMSMEFADPVSNSTEMRLRVCELPRYTFEAYGASICADNSPETGDTSSVFADGTGCSYIVLSDGMGTGRSAAIESRLVVAMFKKLICSGASCGSAVRLVNSIMLAKSADEGFATLDTLRLDLDSGVMTVMKSGASATLIRRGNQVMKVTSPTFPIGIVESAELFSKDFPFDDGDIVIMFSDGISEGEYRFIKELLLQSGDIKAIVDEICAKAELWSGGCRRDDITVIGVKIGKR